jgi:hypothetical protein
MRSYNETGKSRFSDDVEIYPIDGLLESDDAKQAHQLEIRMLCYSDFWRRIKAKSRFKSNQNIRKLRHLPGALESLSVYRPN